MDKLFRPLYYLGCKASFVEPILDAINEVDPTGGRVCDLFAGTGAVGASLAPHRDVTTVDIQEYSRVICSAQLTPSLISESEARQLTQAARSSEISKALSWCFEPVIDFEKEAIADAIRGEADELVTVLEAMPIIFPEAGVSRSSLAAARAAAQKRMRSAGLWGSKEATVVSYFGGVYFSFQQSIFFDAALSQADLAPIELRDTLISAALSTASSIVNTVGKQFAQPIRPRDKSGAIKPSLAAVVRKDRLVDASLAYEEWLTAYCGLTRSGRSHEALRMDYLDALGQDAERFSVIYADPPYTRDHYSRFYHVLETMCLRDAPKVSLVKKRGSIVPSRGVYREDRHQSPFCIRSEAPEALSQLLVSAARRNTPVVLSYSPHEAGDGTHPRVMSASDIVKIAKAFYHKVDVDLLDGPTHNKLNRADLGLLKREHAEMIVKCRNSKI